MKPHKSLAAALLCMLLALLPLRALAAGSIDLSRAATLTVTAVYDRTPISGMRFDAYQISSVDEAGELTVLEPYGDYAGALDIRGKDDGAWQELAQVLAREILLDEALTPSRSAVTDGAGTAAFGDIPLGLYLILGNSVELDGYVYTTAPFFVLLPQQDLESNIWCYDVTANAKPGQEPVRADFKVIKLWEDDCHKEQRPQSIAISLMCDGEVWDTVTLPHEGAWSYTWQDLETNHRWTVTEAAVEGYKPGAVRQEGNTFIVTNTCDKPATPVKPDSPTLPRTGQLWWPVPVLLAAGLLLVVMGLAASRRRSSEK